MPSLVNDSFDIDLGVVREENIINSNQSTDHPVEDEAGITDNIEVEPTRLSIEFTVVGQNADNIEEELEQASKVRETFDYFGVRRIDPYENMVIESFNTSAEKEVSNGFRGSLDLKQVRTVEADTIEVDLGVDPVSGEQAQEEPTELENREPAEDEIDDDAVDPSTLTMMFGGGDNDEG